MLKTHVIGPFVAALIVSACAPAADPAAPSAGNAHEPRSQPKVLTIGIQQEPTDFYKFGSTASGGVANVPPIAQDAMVTLNAQGRYEPLLATESISVERGTWRVNDDGTMDTTWKIRPNVKWHDGAPFSVEDILFGLTVRRDPAIGARTYGRLDLLQSASAVDPLTLVLHWSTTYAAADQALDLDAFPKHLLEDTYISQKESFINSPYLSSQFIGQGPYKLSEWQASSHMIFTRFDDYHQGRPPLDRVTVRFLGDQNTMVANILSGAVDLLPGVVGVDAAVQVEQQWAGTGNQVRYDLTDSPRQVEIQFRPETARPKDGLTNLRVRQAFYHAIDRATLVDVMTQGRGASADSWVAPTSSLRPSLESSIPQFPYDPTRAQQLLTEAGWVRERDDNLANRGSGEWFAAELWTNPGGDEKAMSVIASNWRGVGAQVSEYVIPPARASDREYTALYPTALVTTNPPEVMIAGRYSSKEVRSAANRWNGQNRSGYSNPALDALLDRLTVTINPNDRASLLREIVQVEMGDVVLMSLFWDVAPTLYVRGVKTPDTVPKYSTARAGDFFKFDRDI